MGISRFWRCALVMAAAAGLFFADSDTLWARRTKQRPSKWHIIQTRHYRVRTDISQTVARAISRHMEAMYGEYRRRMSSLPGRRGAVRFEVVIFKDQADYGVFVGPRGRNSGGMFIGHRNSLASFGTEADMERILRVLRHEGFHQFAAGFIGRTMPIWLNEGMAVFFENSEWTTEGLQIGLVPPGRLALLKRARAAKRLLPLVKMLLMSDATWSRNVNSGAEAGDLQYAEAWSMVHFLVYGDKGKYRRHLERYIRQVAKGRSGQQAFNDVFAGDAKGFERRWLAYMDSLKPGDHIRCEHRLLLLVHLLQGVGDRPEVSGDIKTFYEAAVGQKLGAWEGWASVGLKVRSDDIKAVKSLFVCPNDKKQEKPYSYEFEKAKGAAGGLPIIVCRHHAGMIYRATVVRDATTGALEPRILTLPLPAGASKRKGLTLKKL